MQLLRTTAVPASCTGCCHCKCLALSNAALLESPSHSLLHTAAMYWQHKLSIGPYCYIAIAIKNFGDDVL